MLGFMQRTGNAFAAISVSYPAGSVCTCSGNGATYTAGNTDGTWLFMVPKAGTYTIRSAKGSESASQNVSITTRHQAVNVTLTYNYYLIKGGNMQNGLSFYSPADVLENPVQRYYNGDGTYRIKGNSNGFHGIYVSLNLSGWNRIVGVMRKCDALMGYDTYGIGIWENSQAWCSGTNLLAGGTYRNTSFETKSVDISSLNGSYHVGVHLKGGDDVRIKELYLAK